LAQYLFVFGGSRRDLSVCGCCLIHGYGYTQPEDIAHGVAQLKKTLARHGLSSLELWDTEASWGTTAVNDEEPEASWLMRFHLAQAVSGVSRFVWYAYDNYA
jgi:hypothetical protein